MFVVRRSWFVVRGSWFVVRGSSFVARGSRMLERPQQVHQPRQLAFVEPSPCMADVDQISLLPFALSPSFVHPEEQRAEVRSRLPRLGPAADHELLFVDDFQLSPI